MVRSALQASRDNGFQSVNADLIYGLPKQTLDSFSRTLDKLIGLSPDRIALRSEEHTSELQSLMRISYAVFCLKKKKKIFTTTTYDSINVIQLQNTQTYVPPEH